jgi:hypothetical protein
VAQDQVLQCIIDSLSALPESKRNEEANAVAAFMASEFASFSDRKNAVNVDLFDSKTYYAIHDDDLKLLTEAAPVAAAVYAAFPNPASVIAGLVVFLFRYRRKRVRLDRDQAITLLALKESGKKGLTITELLPHLPLELRKEAIVKPVLQSLIAARRDDGTLAKLVEQDSDRYFGLDV